MTACIGLTTSYADGTQRLDRRYAMAIEKAGGVPVLLPTTTSDRRWVEACWRTGRPILGICYGMQHLNALAGGTIYGDVEAEHDGAQTHSQKRGGTTHPVTLRPPSRLRRWLDTETLTVNTRHLQAIATVGEGFAVAATAPDGVVEAIEHESGRLFGVQFHPERMGPAARPLFRALLERAAGASSAASA